MPTDVTVTDQLEHLVARAAGETRFNEAAFDAGRALYDGTLLGRPFRSVAKTFQVRVWRDLRAAADMLKARGLEVMPALLKAIAPSDEYFFGLVGVGGELGRDAGLDLLPDAGHAEHDVWLGLPRAHHMNISDERPMPQIPRVGNERRAR